MISTLGNAKAMGPIPQGFSAIGGELAIGGRRVSDVIAEAGGETPLFVYDAGIVAARIARLRAALPEGVAVHYAVKANPRSEEHTSELQSLMRISYAVFCLKKKNNQNN